MQYLSKAYNYYSGINPATLSGAIDVIVVRHVNEDGEETLSSSPFHVRFGKLQVLRAGEKRVTLRLPNNLPPPHVAPFSMKVGDTGEAFFVLETDDDVPEDLLTSPVVMATDANGLPDMLPSPPPSDDEFAPRPPRPSTPPNQDGPTLGSGSSLTQQPFGSTEQMVHHEGHGHDEPVLSDVEPLDLNEAGDPDDRTDSSNLEPLSPSPLLPSTLLSSISSPNPTTATKQPAPARKSPSQIPNPLEAAPGEDHKLPHRDSLLKHVHRSSGDASLPKVAPGQGEGPDVIYGKDIVLDMEGFHNPGSDSRARTPPHRPTSATDSSSAAKNPLVESLVNDLMASAVPPSRPIPAARLTDSIVVQVPATPEMIPARAEPASASVPDLPSTIASLHLDTPVSMLLRKRSPSPAVRRRGDRGQSEPPAETYTAEPVAAPIEASDMDLAWDWGKLPDGPLDSGNMTAALQEAQREDSGAASNGIADFNGKSFPSAVTEGDGHIQKAKLKNVEEDPYQFVLELDGRAHAFELGLCGAEDFAPQGKATEEQDTAFKNSRVTFQEFIEDPTVVDDPRLVIHYAGLYLTWSTGYHLLFALAIYRRSLAPPNQLAAPPATSSTAVPPRTSGYGWSRWWRRGQSEAAPPGSGSDSDSPAEAALRHLKAGEDDKDTPDTAEQADKVTANGDVPSVPPPNPAQPEKHYAKTLRLSSDQLKQLNLKPGPNTVQFSVTSSYSGFAVCTARIFLWEQTDQVVISDIDGTITKSDALGHVFAAIGRDWTHVGIAKLYTDVCNNGYKILYLTSRAIGQADTTREYLKTINQGDYRMPEGPVIMSPDRLMASLHREVIMRKPELFKMACLRDIQRLFGDYAKEAFFAGFGNRITDAMSYRSVGIETAKIYTIDSTGIVKTELLQQSHKGSYVALNDLVNEVFPPVKTKFVPEYTDFNFWRDPIANIPLPDFTPPSPALSARSDASGASRLSVLGKITSTIGRRASRATSPTPDAGGASPSSPMSERSRPSSPLIGPALTPRDYLSEDEEWGSGDASGMSRPASMPGSFDDDGAAFPESWFSRDREGSAGGTGAKSGMRVGAGRSGEDGAGTGRGGGANGRGGGNGQGAVGEEGEEDGDDEGYRVEGEEDDSFADEAIFDDDILATGEMARVPF